MTSHGWNFGVSDVVNLPTSQGTGYVLAPDGSGGLTWIATSSIGVTDHGVLTGLGDDDHTGYLLATGTRTGAASQIQSFTNGVQLNTIKEIGFSGVTVKSSSDSQILVLTNSSIEFKKSLVMLARETYIRTYDTGFWTGLYIQNASSQNIAYFRPDWRSVGFGGYADYSTGGAQLAVKTVGNIVTFLAAASSGQTVDVVNFVNRYGQKAYKLTYADAHWFLGHVTVAGRVSSAPAFDRLQGADRRYTLTFTNCTGYSASTLFSGLHSGNSMICNAGVEGTVEIDFNPFTGWTAGTNTGFTYRQGALMLTFWPGAEASHVYVDSYQPVGGVDQWVNYVASEQNNVNTFVSIVMPDGVYIKKLRIRVYHASHAVWVSGISYFPTFPESISEMTYLPRFASDALKLSAPKLDYYDTTWTIRYSVDYQVANGATAVAYMYDTANALSTAGAKLASWRNNGTEHTFVDRYGGLTVNETGADTDSRFEGDTATSLLVIDAGLDAVQIGTTTAGVIADFRSTAIVFNEDGADRDVRFEGDTDANNLFSDASTDRIGIGTNAPGYKLDVAGGVNVTAGNVFRVAGTQVVAAQGAAVADASGGATVDAEARTAINDLLARIRAHGLIAT